jgi:hypothetical protein
MAEINVLEAINRMYKTVNSLVKVLAEVRDEIDGLKRDTNLWKDRQLSHSHPVPPMQKHAHPELAKENHGHADMAKVKHTHPEFKTMADKNHSHPEYVGENHSHPFVEHQHSEYAKSESIHSSLSVIESKIGELSGRLDQIQEIFGVLKTGSSKGSSGKTTIVSGNTPGPVPWTFNIKRSSLGLISEIQANPKN